MYLSSLPLVACLLLCCAAVTATLDKDFGTATCEDTWRLELDLNYKNILKLLQEMKETKIPKPTTPWEVLKEKLKPVSDLVNPYTLYITVSPLTRKPFFL